jgi:hypothetical protein
MPKSTPKTISFIHLSEIGVKGPEFFKSFKGKVSLFLVHLTATVGKRPPILQMKLAFI